jgi:biotin carboxyl carrier protein
MKNFKFKIRGEKYEVEITGQEANLLHLEVNGTPYEVELEREVKTSKTPTLVRSSVETHRPMVQKMVTDEFKVKIPLPGIIMNIMVKEGDTIKAGDKLVMYEAMKMENIITAEKPGKVLSIKVKTGDTVLQDDVVLTLSI